MKHKQALRRYRDRSEKKERRMLSSVLAFMPAPLPTIEKKNTRRVFAHYSVDREMALQAGEEYVKFHADRELAKNFGYELLRHAHLEHHKSDFGQSWLASIEVVEDL